MNIRLIAFAFILLGANLIVNAQKVNNYTPWGIKIGYSNYNLGLHNANINNFNTNVTYNVTKLVQVGGSIGYGFYNRFVRIEGGYEGEGKSSALLYGVVANFQTLQLLAKDRPMRFDLYLSAQFNGDYRFSQENEVIERGNYINYGLFMGAAYYFGRQWGTFFEYGYGSGNKVRFGLAFKY